MDNGVVLLEQAWVFWLEDNLEDLEMGARCAEKAVVLLSWQQLCGLAWYWRFMCAHRLLMLQVQGTMVRVGEEWMVGRREGAGRRGAHPGLEIIRLSRLSWVLEQALDVCERMNSKVMLQFMLATAWEMELMGYRAESIHLDQES